MQIYITVKLTETFEFTNFVSLIFGHVSINQPRTTSVLMHQQRGWRSSATPRHCRGYNSPNRGRWFKRKVTILTLHNFLRNLRFCTKKSPCLKPLFLASLMLSSSVFFFHCYWVEPTKACPSETNTPDMMHLFPSLRIFYWIFLAA